MTKAIQSRPGYERVLRLVRERAGLCFHPHRCGNACAAIERTMSSAGLADVEHYCDLLSTDAAAFDRLIVELTVGETYFFREPAHFAFVRRTVLPDLLERKGDQHTVRVWSAGCASGEEAYSLAMLFAEAGLAGRTHILATDISRAALARSQEAVYREWSLRGAGATTARAWLRRRGDSYLLDEGLRRRVALGYLNLALDVYPSFSTGAWGMDLIFCRNVLIYFDPATVERVARRLFETLAPGGWLVTASCDPPLGGHAAWEVLTTDEGVFYRRPLGFLPAVDAVVAPGSSHDSAAEGRVDALDTEPALPAATMSAPAGPEGVPFQEPEPEDTLVPLAAARDALARGDFRRAIDVARGRPEDPACCAVEVQALAQEDSQAAEQLCAQAAARHPLAVELHYLHAILLVELDRAAEAAQAARRAIYLDRSLAVAHFALGVALARQGDLPGARRAFRNLEQLCSVRPADEEVPLSNGEHAGRLAAAAAAQLAILTAPDGAKIQ